MQLFRGRVLAAAGAAILLWSVLAFWQSRPVWYILAAVFAVLFCLLFLFLRRKGKISAYRFLSVSVGAALFLLFLLRTGLFYFGIYQKAMQYAGDIHSVRCCVTERQNFTGYSSRYLVEIRSVDGEKCDTRALLSCDFASDYPLGTVLSLDGAMVTSAGEAYPGNISDGILLSVEVNLSRDVHTEGEEDIPTLESGMRAWNRRLSSRLKQTVGGREGKLCARMVLGGRDMDPEQIRDFRRAGVAHLLSVSGMHLSLLCFALDRLLLRLRCGKGLRMAVLSVGIVAYLFLLNFPASAVRAGGMLLLSYAICILGGDTDPLTSLFLSLSAILFVNPTAILDTGFILSASATFGILSLGPVYAGWGDRYARYLSHRPRKVGERRVFRHLCEQALLWFLKKGLPPLAVIFSANMMTSVPVAFLFGKVSVLSPLSNVLAPLPAEGAILLSVCVLLFPEGSFLQGMAAYYAKKCAGFLLWVTGELSDIRGAELSLRDPVLRGILIAATALTLLLLCIRLRRRLFAAAPFFAAVLCVAGYVCFAVPDTVHVFFRETGTEDTVAAVAHGTAVIADFTSGSGRALSEAVTLSEEAGATEVEALVLTHYHAKHVGTVETLLLQKKVRRLWLPEPVTKNDASVFLSLCGIADRLGVECRIYGEEDPFVIFGSVTLTASGPREIARSTHPVLSLQLRDESRRLLFWGKSAEENEALLSALQPGDYTDIVLGNHGPVQKKASAEELCLCGRLHIFAEEKMSFLVGGRDPAPWFGRIILHEKTAYFQFLS